MKSQPLCSVLQLKIDAEKRGWKMVHACHKKARIMLYSRSFQTHMDVFIYTKKIITCMNHPSKGVTIMQREKNRYGELLALLDNPRKHTGKGEYITLTEE